jgi:hypothetical protein
MLASLAKEINTTDGSFMIQWPANIPSNMRQISTCLPRFLQRQFDPSDSFVLTGETQHANVTGLSKDGISAGDKAAIGVLVLVTVTSFLHRFRSELSGKNEVQQEKDGTLMEMPNETLNEMHTDNNWPVEMPGTRIASLCSFMREGQHQLLRCRRRILPRKSQLH